MIRDLKMIRSIMGRRQTGRTTVFEKIVSDHIYNLKRFRDSLDEINPIVILSPNLRMRKVGAIPAPSIKDHVYIAIINPLDEEVMILENNSTRRMSYQDYMDHEYSTLIGVDLFLDGAFVGKWKGLCPDFVTMGDLAGITYTTLTDTGRDSRRILFGGDAKNTDAINREIYQCRYVKETKSFDVLLKEEPADMDRYEELYG